MHSSVPKLCKQTVLFLWKVRTATCVFLGHWLKMSLLISLSTAKIFTVLLIYLIQQAQVPACILDAKTHSAP